MVVATRRHIKIRYNSEAHHHEQMSLAREELCLPLGSAAQLSFSASSRPSFLRVAGVGLADRQQLRVRRFRLWPPLLSSARSTTRELQPYAGTPRRLRASISKHWDRAIGRITRR